MPDPFLYERVFRSVLESIRDGSLGAGDRVPSEKELADQFGVSRITSKRALDLLAETKVVDRKRGKGSFVTEDPRRLEALRTGEEAPPRRTSCIALVLPDASEAYGLDLLCAIEERCAEQGYHLVVRRTRGRQDVEEEAIRALVRGGVTDGLIVFPVHGEFYNASLVRLVLDRSPLVLVDRYLPGIPACAIHTDNAAASRALTRHLIDGGHEQLAFLSPPVENTSSIEERIQGFELALRERGLAADSRHAYTQMHSTLPGSNTDRAIRTADRQAVRAFVEREPQVTAFVACEYTIAVLLRDVLDELGRTKDQIACFDSPATLGPPAFAHIQQDQGAMGRRAVDLLVAQLNGEPVPVRSIVPFSLVAVPGRLP